MAPTRPVARRVAARDRQPHHRRTPHPRLGWLTRWQDPKFLVPLLVAMMAQRTGCRAEKGNQQVATSVVAMVRDESQNSAEMDSLRQEVGRLREMVMALGSVREPGASLRRGESAVPSPAEKGPIDLLAVPARAAWAGVRWLFQGG